MIRTKTAVVIGSGASVEIELPGQREMLASIAQGFDFQRLGSDLATPETGVFDALFRKVKNEGEKLREAALRIRAGSRLSTSIHALLQQHGEDAHVVAAGKLAVAYYTLKAERDCAMEAEPRDPGDLPFRGNENWLYQLGLMVVDGVSRSRAEHCLDNLQIVNFNTDRAVEHYIPWVLHSGFGMPITEAQQLCAEKLKLVHPYGRAGRLPWQAGGDASADWGADDMKALFKVAEGIRTPSELAGDRQLKASIQSGLGGARRLVFVGFDFNSLDTTNLFQERLSHNPETLVSLGEGQREKADTIRQVLKGLGGISPDTVVAMQLGRSWQMLSDYKPLLES